MAYEMKNGSGSLFKNEKKSADTHADYNGSIMVEGREYWLNAWIKESATGKKYMSLSIKPKDDASKDVRRPVEDTRKGSMKDKLDDDSIPF